MPLRTFLIVLTVLFAALPAAAQELMPIEEIEVGMRGVGKSVFEGNAIEEFEVEILGVLRNAIGPKQDLILARLHGERVEFTGVVAGMSGSPVFIDGRLIGAVSYRIGSFAKEPIAGITPIRDMLKLEELEWRTARESGEELLGGMISVLQDPDEGQVGAARQKDLSHRVTSAGSSIQPIRTPLVFSGFAPEVLDAVAPFFESRGFQPAMGGGSSDDVASDGADLLQAGSPVAGQMVRGDMGIAATGTVTYREGNRVLAFGHPLLRMGPVKIPMATAKILHTLPSSLGSFKISTPGKIVGQIRQDRLTAILGVIGDLPTMIPVDLDLRGRGRDRSFNFEVFDNQIWTPVLVYLTIGNGLYGTVDFSSESTLQLTAKIGFRGHPDLELQNIYTSLGRGTPLPFVMSLDVAKTFALLYNNLFEEPVVEGISVRIDTVEEARLARVADIRARKVEVEPGEEISLDVRVVPYRGEPVLKRVTLKIPENTPPGQMILLAGSHQSLARAEGGLFNYRIANAGSFSQLLNVLSEEKRSDRIYFKLYRRVEGAVVQSEILTDLPPSVLSVFGAQQVSQSQAKLPIAAVRELSIPTDWILTGAQRLNFTVK